MTTKVALVLELEVAGDPLSPMDAYHFLDGRVVWAEDLPVTGVTLLVDDSAEEVSELVAVLVQEAESTPHA